MVRKMKVRIDSYSATFVLVDRAIGEETIGDLLLRITGYIMYGYNVGAMLPEQDGLYFKLEDGYIRITYSWSRTTLCDELYLKVSTNNREILDELIKYIEGIAGGKQ